MHEDHLRGVDLNLLVALAALVREQSVTRAAARMGVTQSAMSRTLARLRDLIGDPLLVRSGRAMTPTPRTAALAGPLDRLLEDARALLEPPQPFDPATARRTFSIATVDYIVLILLPRLAARLAVEAPGVGLSTATVGPPEDLTGLLDARTDLAMAPDLPAGGAIRRLRAIEDDFVSLVRADHPALQGPGLDLATYARLPHLLVAPQNKPGGVVDTALARHGLTRRVAVRVQTFAVAGEIVANSDLVATLPRQLVIRMAPQLPLRLFEPPLTLPTFGIYVYWHERHQHDSGHAWMRQLVVRTLRSAIAEPVRP